MVIQWADISMTSQSLQVLLVECVAEPGSGDTEDWVVRRGE
jgi:hypothetical protein